MPGYTKLHSSIATSTIMGESPVVFKVFILMLSLAGIDGVIEASVPGLARLANQTVEEVEAAIETLSSPDKYSRTRDNEGRRIEKVDGGWWLLNFEKYKYMLSEEDRRKRDRIRQQRHRNFQASRASGVTERDTGVTECDSHAVSHVSRMSRQEEEEEEETKNKPPKRQKPKPGILNSIEAAKGYCNTFSITGGRLGSNYDAIREAIEVEMANSSGDPQAIAQRMIEARERLDSIPKTEAEWDGGAVHFITSGRWRNPKTWRKDGGAVCQLPQRAPDERLHGQMAQYRALHPATEVGL
jgi:hypothetical protein